MQLPSDDFGCPPPIPLLCADSELADIAIDNAIDLAEHISILALRWDREYRFTPDVICECNHIAMRGIYECAGKFRDRIVLVGNFVPPPYREIPSLVSGMCEYANTHQDDPFHVAAYLLWRTNWIHPFYDGNGRVSRELCCLAISVGIGDAGLGDELLPELIDKNRDEYIRGLGHADSAWDGTTPDVHILESLLLDLFLG